MKNQFLFKNVKSVHLEVTDKCNAACPMCPRTLYGGPLNPNIKNTELNLADIKKIFTPDILLHLEQIYLCGTFGEPIVARDTLEIFKYFRSQNPNIKLGMHTNGSARSAEWWFELGKILSGGDDYCKFGIDGLEDTNHIYRRNTNWSKIMTSVENFIKGGGQAHWEFLVFKHNQHQIDDAKSLATKLGFKAFYVKKTARFFDYLAGKHLPYPVIDKLGNILYYIDPPEEERLVNSFTALQEQKTSENENSNVKLKKQKTEKKKPLKFKKIGAYLKDRKVINCLAIKEKTIYISASGEVFPCCFLGGQMQYLDPGIYAQQIDQLVRKAEKDWKNVNAKNKAIPQIVNGKWFKAVAQSWDRPSLLKGRVGTCLHQCGSDGKCQSDFTPFKSEYR